MIGHQMETKFEHAAPPGEVQLILVYAGQVKFEYTCWARRCHRMHWVLDLITEGSQQQRVASGPSFEREPGLLALYAPATPYTERTVAGQVVHEAYMVFAASGTTDSMLRGLTGTPGYCHIQDPCEVIADLLKRLDDYHRVGGPGTPWLSSGLMLQALGLLRSATVVKPGLRRIAPRTDSDQSLLLRVADYLEANIARPLSVADVAVGMGMSQSALAHTYPQLAGETPYQAIVRSKMNAAKRLLVQEGLNVQQTAQRLGFRSAFNFSRTFKRAVGCAPTHYLAQYTSEVGSGP